MNAQPVFCCKDMAKLMSSGIVSIGSILGICYGASISTGDRGVPLKYCPSCGKAFHLTFLTDSEVFR